MPVLDSSTKMSQIEAIRLERALNRQQQAGPSQSTTCWIILVCVLLASNTATAVFLVLNMVNKDKSESSTTCTTTIGIDSRTLYSGMHPIAVAPTSRLMIDNISSPHMQRSALNYAGSSRSSYTVAAGVNQILNASGSPIFEVHTEVVNNSALGQYAGVGGRVGNRALTMRFVDLSTMNEAVLVPFGLSLKFGISLVPNFFYFSYRAGGTEEPVTSFVSTVTGQNLFYGEAGAEQWNAVMLRALDAYETAWESDFKVASSRRGRHLGFWNWVGGQVGGMLGSSIIGGSEGSAIGGAVGKIATGANFGDTVGKAECGYIGSEYAGAWGGTAGAALWDMGADGDSVGTAVGSTVGWKLGSEAGSDFGKDVGADAGTALGTAVGGPLGGAVGEEVGSWLGSKAGSYLGGEAGSDLGNAMGNDFESDVDNWGRHISSWF